MSKKDKSEELLIAKKEIASQKSEKKKRASELITANKELAFQNEEKEKRANDLLIANKELVYQISERKQAEEVLSNERTLLRTILDLLPSFVFVKDRESRFLMANVACSRFMGATSPQELIGKTDAEFYQANAAIGFRSDELGVLEGIPVVDKQEGSASPDGTPRNLLTTKVPLRDSEGNIIGLVGVSFDITELKRSEEVLRESESSLRNAQEIAKMGSWEWDMITQKTNWSDNYFAIHGFKPAEVEPSFELFRSRIHPDDVHLLDETHAKIMKDKTPSSIEFRLIQTDGTFKWIQNYISPVIEDDKLVKLKGVIIDITDRKQAERELLKHRDHLEELVNERTEELRGYMDEIRDLYENAPCGYHSLDENGKFVRINNTELKWLGYTRDEVIGRMGSADMLTPESVEIFKSAFPAFMKQGEISNLEFEYKRKDGSTFFGSLNATVIYDADGKFLMSRSTLFDVTDRKLAEEALSNAKKEAEDANKAKSEFLANMSHEIRTPMNAVLGYTELLGSTLVDQIQKDYINSIKSSGRSLLTLINDILDLSKIEAGKLEMEYDYVDTYSFFSEFEKIFSLKVTEKGLKFILDITSGTPQGVYIDEARVRQIVFNLIGNAIKFTLEGKITLKVYTENPQIVNYSKEKTEELIDLIIEVKDTGIGISKELQEAIFEPFVQERDYKHYGGTGLGLAITRRLTALMNGNINVQSELGKGSTFIVRIPGLPYLRDFSKVIGDIQIDPSEIVFEKAVILIADDVQHNRSYLRDALKNTNLEIVEAEDGLEAYKLAKEIVPDLIIADIRMPKMDGFQLLNKLKTDKKLKHIPAIAYSASVLKSQKERIHKSEFAGLLIKPVKVAELYIELMNFLPFKSTRETESDMPYSEVDLFGEITDLPGLIQSLETTFYTTWKTFAETQPIREIREFGKNLSQLGLDHNSNIITGYGKDLINAADSFNIGAILKLIGKYKGIIGSLKGSTKNISYD